MLQQTQVGTVIPYFERFIERFPDVRALAAASVDEVLALWSGLGYYARARNLHRAARVVVADFGGTMPEAFDDLVGLPGIGRSTAGAILALASNQRHPILDGNVKRVLARFHAVEGWPGKSHVARELWELAESHTPDNEVSDYTQAIMDLGATLCRRRQPLCDACPVMQGCIAKRQGNQHDFPGSRPKLERPRREVTVLVVQNGAGDILLERRPPTGVWGGLLSFPELAAGDEPDAWCHRHIGVAPVSQQPLESLEHGFTHFVLNLLPVRLVLESSGSTVMDADQWLWYKSAEPLPGGIAKPIGKILNEVIQAESSN